MMFILSIISIIQKDGPVIMTEENVHYPKLRHPPV